MCLTAEEKAEIFKAIQCTNLEGWYGNDSEDYNPLLAMSAVLKLGGTSKDVRHGYDGDDLCEAEATLRGDHDGAYNLTGGN